MQNNHHDEPVRGPGKRARERRERRMRFRSWLLAELEAREWSHHDLAERTGIDRSSVSKWARGERIPTYENCIALAAALGVNEVTVLAAADYPTRETGELSEVQRDLIQLVRLLPDDLLVTLRPMVRSLLNDHVRAQVRRDLRLAQDGEPERVRMINSHA